MGLKLLHKTHFTNALQLQLQAKLIPFEKYKYSTLIFFFFLLEIEIDVFFSLSTNNNTRNLKAFRYIFHREIMIEFIIYCQKGEKKRNYYRID